VGLQFSGEEIRGWAHCFRNWGQCEWTLDGTWSQMEWVFN